MSSCQGKLLRRSRWGSDSTQEESTDDDDARSLSKNKLYLSSLASICLIRYNKIWVLFLEAQRAWAYMLRCKKCAARLVAGAWRFTEGGQQQGTTNECDAQAFFFVSWWTRQYVRRHDAIGAKPPACRCVALRCVALGRLVNVLFVVLPCLAFAPETHPRLAVQVALQETVRRHLSCTAMSGTTGSD